MTDGYMPQQGYIASESKNLRMPTSAKATDIREKITPPTPLGKSAKPAGEQSRLDRLPAGAAKRTGCTTSARS